MKAIRLFGVALFTVFLSVGFSACSSSSDDDDSNGVDTSISIEGKWKKISEKEYDWNYNNNKPDFDRCRFTSNSIGNLTSFSKNGKNLILTSLSSGKSKEWFYISENEYYFLSDGVKSHQLIIQELTKEQLIIYVREHYFTGGGSIVIVLTYIRQ